MRIALNLKGIAYRPHFVHLLRGGGEQHRTEYRTLNPQGLVPSLIDDGATLTQSLAIIEYLEETYPEPPLLPATPADRAWVRSLAQTVACDIHPLNNLRVLDYLKQTMGQTEAACRDWIRHWIVEGFRALESRIEASPRAGTCCLGDAPTLADICLIPQIYNARRFDCKLEPFPRIQAIEAHCQRLAAFREAAPECQPDAA